FRPHLTGITQLVEFSVYNRWGQKVFTTSEKGGGWNGRIQGREAGNDTFVWVLKAIDFVGKVYQMKGTVTVIR
ncbi:MAG: gliding motility-associated C-terminal domain-containing protein, partial [Flavisolibacter sp.]|nr:gliding motility-associated C-terminal domain-containing protein [Flavisolibacter sp.]